MQYILTEQEYKNLVPKQREEELMKALELARLKLLEVSDMKCVNDFSDDYCGYCDCCPCSEADNEWNLLWSLVCTKSKSYSK